MASLVRVRKTLAYHLTESPARLLARTPVTPNTLSWLGFVLAAGAAALIARGYLLAAGFVFLGAGYLDILDGALARLTGRSTRFGAILDATLDRASEAVMLFGVLVWFLLSGEQPLLFTTLGREWSVAVVFLTLPGSMLVSYIRARAEANGLECQSGFFTRGERVAVLVLGLWLNQMVIALSIIAVLSYITAGQRLLRVWQQTRGG